MPKFHKLQRGSCLALFVASSISSYFNPHMVIIAGLSILGVVAYDIVCFFKQRYEVKDYGPEIEKLSEQVNQTSQHIKEMKDDVSVAKLANSFRR